MAENKIGIIIGIIVIVLLLLVGGLFFLNSQGFLTTFKQGNDISVSLGAGKYWDGDAIGGGSIGLDEQNNLIRLTEPSRSDDYINLLSDTLKRVTGEPCEPLGLSTSAWRRNCMNKFEEKLGEAKITIKGKLSEQSSGAFIENVQTIGLCKVWIRECQINKIEDTSEFGNPFFFEDSIRIDFKVGGFIEENLCSSNLDCGNVQTLGKSCWGDLLRQEIRKPMCLSDGCHFTDSRETIETCEFGCEGEACLPEPEKLGFWASIGEFFRKLFFGEE